MTDPDPFRAAAERAAEKALRCYIRRDCVEAIAQEFAPLAARLAELEKENDDLRRIVVNAGIADDV